MFDYSAIAQSLGTSWSPSQDCASAWGEQRANNVPLLRSSVTPDVTQVGFRANEAEPYWAQAIDAVWKRWCPGTELNCRHADFQSAKDLPFLKQKHGLTESNDAVVAPPNLGQIAVLQEELARPPFARLPHEFFARRVRPS